MPMRCAGASCSPANVRRPPRPAMCARNRNAPGPLAVARGCDSTTVLARQSGEKIADFQCAMGGLRPSTPPSICVPPVVLRGISTRFMPYSNDACALQHDVQLDYYGKRLATASSDRMIKIFDVSPDQTQHQLSASIQAHEGPVWQVAWAHPKFGSILASCSYDRKVCVWKETQPQQWTKVYEYADHQSSVNSIAFAPHDLGLKLAAASADGSISILSWRGPQDNAWEEKQIHNAHQIGCNAVSWAPAAAPGSATGSGGTQATLVTGGCDGLVKVWDLPENGEAVLDSEFEMAYKVCGKALLSPPCAPCFVPLRSPCGQ